MKLNIHRTQEQSYKLRKMLQPNQLSFRSPNVREANVLQARKCVFSMSLRSSRNRFETSLIINLKWRVTGCEYRPVLVRNIHIGATRVGEP